MAIIEISKIQHRYGRRENLPQLSAAELGWAIDARRLYIGNGPVSEGAPTVGNTEVLTEFSDILSFTDSYQYRGSSAGYNHITGSSGNTPTVRSLQSKIDEIISVKDFGALGDGSTDDTDAINRAMRELFARETTEEIRRCLFFPAGIYITAAEIKIPPYARLVGEGKQSSIINRTSGTGAVATLSDSKHQTNANLGLNGAVMPRFVEVYAMSFENSVIGDVIDITSANHVRFESVRFKGSADQAPTSVSGSTSCVRLASTAVNQSRSLVFEQCDFSHNVFGVLADDDMQGITVNNSVFEELFKGVKLGEATTGSGSSVDGPRGVRITNSLFDRIYSTGIHCYQIGDIVSSFNLFLEVANGLAGDGAPIISVVIFGGDNCASMFDMFDRNDTDHATHPRVDRGDSDVLLINPGKDITYGSNVITPGRKIRLVDNSTAANTVITFDNSVSRAAKITYQATRGTGVRIGTLLVAADSAGDDISDVYVENGSAIGLTFAIDVTGTTTTLQYTTTNTGEDVLLNYKIERFF